MSPDKSSTKQNGNFDRRNILLGGTTLAAATALGTPASLQKAVAQQATPSGERPNIIFIMGDDIGWFNIGAYHRGMMAGRTPNLDRLASEGMMLLTIMPRRAAPPGARISSPANCRSAPA
jgi:arylsulfatase